MTASWEHPPSLWMNGKLVPWNEGMVHVTSGYAQRGASVFEGVRIYRSSHTRTYLALALQEHLNRLAETWKLLSLPDTYSDEAIRAGIAALLSEREIDDGYCRITRYLGNRTIDNPSEPDGIFIALYNSPQLIGKPVSCITSSWRRNSLAMPAQMKIGGHYFMLSWLRQQAQRSGVDDAILLNDRDNVCEATGNAVFVYTNGCLVTPPTSDGALPSITAQLVTRLAADLKIPFAIRSVHRTELFRSQGVFLAGSLDELRPITQIDGVVLPDAMLCRSIAELFQAYSLICRAQNGTKWGTLLHA